MTQNIENQLWRDRNKIFVAGIPPDVDDEGLKSKFQPYGEMFQAKVVYDVKTGRSKGFGFVTYSEYESCLDAINALNQQPWEKRVLNVRFLTPKNDSTPKTIVRPRPENCTSIYVGNLSYEISETVLRKVFSDCGEIKAIRFAEDMITNEFRGFGYIDFGDEESCEKAMALVGLSVMGRPIKIDYNDMESKEVKEELEKKLKKGICHKFQQGTCDRGDSCKFAHVLDTQPQEIEIQHMDEPIEEPKEDAPVCLNFQKGACKRGNSCRYLHAQPSPAEIKMVKQPFPVLNPLSSNDANSKHETDKTPVCKNFLLGSCHRGKSCRFIHSSSNNSDSSATQYQKRFLSQCYNYQRNGSCARGDQCQFTHDNGENPRKRAKV